MNITTEFQAPSSTYRPIPFWYWNETRDEKFTPALVEKQISELHEKGFGGFIIFNKPNTDTSETFGFTPEEYLGQKWLDMCRVAVEKAATLGMEAWINDGFDFPPGDLGGRMKNLVPEAYQRELLFSKSNTRPADTEDVISVVDGSDEYKYWTVSYQKPERPEGHLHRFPAFLDPKVNEVFIREVYETYKSSIGDLFGAELTGFFADCDARRATHFPWARDFDKRFEQNFGYHITDHLHLLWVETEESSRIRHDYYSFLSEQYSSWFKNCHAWCKQNNLKYMYHTSDTGPFSVDPESNVYCARSSYFIEGKPSDVNSHCDYVGTDHELMALNGGLHFDYTFKGKVANWNPEPLVWGKSEKRNDFERLTTENKTYGDIRAKLASSIAHSKGKLGAVCEAYAASNSSVTLEDLKWIADWQMSQGITKIIAHACLYSVEGYRKVVFFPNQFRQSHLWYNYNDYADYIGRLTSLLSAGRHVADIAILEPSESLWKNKDFNPLPFFDTLDLLNHSPWDYNIIAEEDLENNKHHKIIILAGLTDVSTEAQKTITGFQHVIELDSLIDIPNSTHLAHTSFDNESIATENPLLETIESMVKPDLAVFDNDKRIGGVHFNHRRTDDHEIYFIANIESEESSKITLNLPLSTFEPQIWNPTNGEKYSVKSKNIEDRMEFDIDLPFKSSTFIIIPKKETEKPAALPTQKEYMKLADWTVKPKATNIVPIPSLSQTFEFDSEISNCQLLLPDIVSATLNGTTVNSFVCGEEMFFDCRYLIHDIPLVNGKNRLVLDDIGDLIHYRNALLRGDFLVNVEASGERIPYKTWYHFNNCVLSKTNVTLQPNNNLSLSDWSKQGYPFYSGVVNYTTRFKINTLKQNESILLSLKTLQGSAQVTVNDVPCGSINFSPYQLDITKAITPGNNELTISVRNTDANILEEYPERSGIDGISLLIQKT